MVDEYATVATDVTRHMSFDTAVLLSNSTINALHFPDLTTSGISDTGGGGGGGDERGSRATSFVLDGIGMCESMTESTCSTGGQNDSVQNNHTNTHQSDASVTNNFKLEKKDLAIQKKRRSRKSQYDALIDVTSFDKIETVAVIDGESEPDDVW